MTVEELLDRARARLDRVEPSGLEAALTDPGTVVVDMRGDDQRAEGGPIDGSVVIARNVLEWRCDPASRWRDPAVSDPALRVVLVCQQGYQSSLAAATLQDLGLPRATDLAGGFEGWCSWRANSRGGGCVSGI